MSGGLALYRRHRPLRFADLVGQDVVAETLRNEVRSGALVHAYLFAGVRGTGKTSTARILARAVNCESPVDGEPCNRCGACREILEDASVDVLEIDAASNRGIDAMLGLREGVKYLPASLRRKVYIVDEAHMLTTEAWNAFLKTLEEPPAHVLFVLATTEPHKIPETARSRVQRFDFRRVPTPSIEGHLAAVAEQEGEHVQPDALRLLAGAAQGSLRDALVLLEQSLASGERPVTLETARRALGLTDPGTLHLLVQAMAGGDAAGALRSAAAAFEAGADPRQLLRDVARLARAAELHALGYPEGAEVGRDEAALAADLAAVAPAGFWLTALELIATMEMDLRQPVDARIQVELCLLRLMRPPAGEAGGAALLALETRVAALERSGATRRADPAPTPAAGEPVVAEVAQVAPAAAAADVLPADVDTESRDLTTVEGWRTEWPVVIEAVGRANMGLAGVLRGCRPIEAHAGHLTIGTQGKFHHEQISDAEKRRVIEAALATIAGRPVEVETQFSGEEPPPRGNSSGAVSDVTQAVLDTFAGSRVTATRLHDESDPRAPRNAPGA